MRVTPPIQTKGRFEFRAPFQSDATTIYVCIALRKFADVEEGGISVFDTFYKPHGLTDSNYRNDAAQGTLIVTLMDVDGVHFHIPDTYIASFPNMGGVAYQHTVLSVSLGAIPTYIPLTSLQADIANFVTDVTGVETTVAIHVAPSRDEVTPEQHEVAEAARVAKIKYRETTTYQLEQALAKNVRLEEQNAVLVEALVNAGIIT